MTETYSTQILHSEADTVALGARLALQLNPGQVVYLHGDLGAGKTTLVRAILHALGHVGKVKSPTYTLVETYAVPLAQVHHFDLYRFQDDEEWEAAGFRDDFNAHSLCLVEWPEKAAALLPAPDIAIYFEILPNGRRLRIDSQMALALDD